jgi:flotillin
LTVDNVSVSIKGLAVYKISEPLKIYKLINFSERSRGELKLAEMIGGMCRSTSKWIIANMTLDECIRKRKEEIADALVNEVSKIVSTWGTELVTIHINDVYIQDEEIFKAMQGIFKSEKLKASELAQLEMSKNLELKKLENERLIAENRKETELSKARIEAEVEQEKIRLARQNDQNKFEMDRYRARENESIAAFKQEQLILREKSEVEWQFARTKSMVEAKKLEHDEQVEHLKKTVETENLTTPAGIEKTFMEKALPKIAECMAANLSHAKLTVFRQGEEGGALPLNMVVSEIFDLLRTGLNRSGSEKK